MAVNLEKLQTEAVVQQALQVIEQSQAATRRLLRSLSLARVKRTGKIKRLTPSYWKGTGLLSR
jgi:hypothetical protein